MAHFLLLCSHTRALDEVGEAELTEFAENPEAIPSYAWCDRCVTWQPVAELVTAPAPPPNLHAFVEATDLEPGTDPSATAPTAGRHRSSSRSEQYAR